MASVVEEQQSAAQASSKQVDSFDGIDGFAEGPAEEETTHHRSGKWFHNADVNIIAVSRDKLEKRAEMVVVAVTEELPKARYDC